MEDTYIFDAKSRERIGRVCEEYLKLGIEEKMEFLKMATKNNFEIPNDDNLSRYDLQKDWEIELTLDDID